ncbi:MAG: class I SAM-dependent methyltransferase [Sideroxydans sp.]
MNRIKEYEKQYMHDYGFEKVMVWARQKYVESLVRKLQPATVMEIGCGFNQLFTHVVDVSSIKKWTIVEPADFFSAAAREKLKDDKRVEVIQGFVESVVTDTNFSNVDLCICAGLLHEVEHPDQILQAAKKSLSENGVLHISVPNAKSFHRMLAVEMGLIPSPYQFSDRNVTLSQYHVFDAASLHSLVDKVGLDSVDAGGYFIKPFTHSQMEKVIDDVGEEVLEGLWHMGAKSPELASEIFVNAKRR